TLPVTSHALALSFSAPPSSDTSSLSLHDALPISIEGLRRSARSNVLNMSAHLAEPKAGLVSPVLAPRSLQQAIDQATRALLDQRSEEHTSELSHGSISYAVFCLKKKKTKLRRTKM